MSSSTSWIDFLKSSYFLKNLAKVVGLLIVFFLLVSFLLKQFTNHGEAIVMPDFIGEFLETSQEKAKKHNFNLVLSDSVFIVGEPGGKIINQNPQPGSKVKRKRSVYLTVTKAKADEIPASRLPVLYGKSYERKSRELKNGFEIFTRIADYKYDPGPENYILAVIYRGDTIVSEKIKEEQMMIERGSTLDFILSKSSGGAIDMPNMVCKSFEEAVFLARTLNIKLVDESEYVGPDKGSSFIYRQLPEFSPEAKILIGDTLMVFLQFEKPPFCDGD